jgi:hypothetical protein
VDLPRGFRCQHRLTVSGVHRFVTGDKSCSSRVSALQHPRSHAFEQVPASVAVVVAQTRWLVAEDINDALFLTQVEGSVSEVDGV